MKSLTPAESRVVSLLKRGLSNAEIARRVDRSVGTIKNQMSSAYQKLGLRSRAELIARLR